MPAAECSTLPWEKNWSRSPKIIILSGDIEELGEMLRAVRCGRSVTRPHIQGHPAASPPLPGPPCARCGGGGRTDGARRSHKVGQTGPCARMEGFELTRFPLSHLSENIDYRDTTIGRSGEKVYPPPPQKKVCCWAEIPRASLSPERLWSVWRRRRQRRLFTSDQIRARLWSRRDVIGAWKKAECACGMVLSSCEGTAGLLRQQKSSTLMTPQGVAQQGRTKTFLVTWAEP